MQGSSSSEQDGEEDVSPLEDDVLANKLFWVQESYSITQYHTWHLRHSFKWATVVSGQASMLAPCDQGVE